MNQRAWAIKLGPGGSAINFCERYSIVGIGWHDAKHDIVMQGDRATLWQHLRDVYPRDPARAIGTSAGNLFRFARECSEGDYVLYYDPPNKRVRVCRVISPCSYRDFDLTDQTDIWHFRRVEYSRDTIPILDLYGSLKGKLLGPRMSFWQLSESFETVDAVVRGLAPHVLAAPDSELQDAYSKLQELAVRRLEVLNEKDWELLIADYFKAQGAHVDESKIGGTGPVIDVEARFDHGDLGEELWRVQVKRQNQKVEWPQIEEDLKRRPFLLCFRLRVYERSEREGRRRRSPAARGAKFLPVCAW